MNNEKQLSHDEIRLIILSRLYEKHYQGQSGEFHDVTNTFSDILELQPDYVTGDLIYLRDKNLIEGLSQISLRRPVDVKISADGIDRCESAMQKACEKSSDNNILEFVKSDSKTKGFGDVHKWFKDSHPWHEPVARILMLIINALSQ